MGRNDAREHGFTLVEVMVTTVVLAVFAALALTSVSRWSSSSAHKGARDEVVSLLRNAAERALSEGHTYCIEFTGGGSWKTWRTKCASSGGTVVGTGQGVNDSGTSLTASFTYGTGPDVVSDCPGSGTCAYFYPRGTASGGTVAVTRNGKTYTVVLEQLTSRVYVQ